MPLGMGLGLTQQRGGVPTIEVASASAFNDIRNNLGYNYILTDDIALTDYQAGAGWIPIGTSEAPFTGTLNGNGHSITGLIINNDDLIGGGLFNEISGAIIENLTITDASITGYRKLAILVSIAQSSTIKDCTISGAVTGVSGDADAAFIGALAYQILGGNVSDCSANATIVNEAETSGFIYSIQAANVDRCSFTGSITNDALNNGGFAEAISQSNVRNCYVQAVVDGGFTVSGFTNNCVINSNIINCYVANTYTIDFPEFECAAFAYISTDSNITTCYYDSDITTLTDENATGLTTANMKKEATFVDAGWDFTNIWQIVEDVSYPTLQ